MQNTITILNWDSDFFHKKVARVNGCIANNVDLNTINSQLAQQDIVLAYYSSDVPLPAHLLTPGLYHIKLVDKKTTFLKPLGTAPRKYEGVTAYTSGEDDEKLQLLSVQSGVYSRFKVDEQIGLGKMEELYRKWMLNSVNKDIAMQVLVYKQESSIEGVITLGEQNGRADIGIVAVDEPFRGQGIGTKLISAAETWFNKNTCHIEIQVVTQLDNTPACRLYESAGYSIDCIKYFYHWWRR